jgi:preprotein translocase subunit SecF
MFMRWRYLYLLLSACVIVPGLVCLARFGLRPSIDFTGGALLEVRYAQKPNQPFVVNQASVQATVGDLYAVAAVQLSGEHSVIMRGAPMSNDQKDVMLAKLGQQLDQVEVLRFETVGPILGKELLAKTYTAAALVAAAIMLFVGRQFHRLSFGVSAVLAMLHDSLVLVGVFSFLGWWKGVEVDVLFVTALLTTLSFSVHDTIVVFDRIREMTRLHPSATLRDIADAAVLQTLGRSLNNSLTIIIMLVCLVWFGGSTIRVFGLALLIGVAILPKSPPKARP